ncbi:MAG: MarR family transcriptional regulator [Candidatus Peribacteria bacterium]|nr:MarR family transcriptional regulator [Candidatus Peribacteria bacterium]
MINISSNVQFLLSLTKAESIVTRRFDSGLGGLSLSDFMILFELSQAREEKMRRIDLAETVGLTASGITRLLAPMEKVGLIKREAHEQDARVSFVKLAPGGKAKLTDALEDAEDLAKRLIPSSGAKNIQAFAEVLKEIGRNAL